MHFFDFMYLRDGMTQMELLIMGPLSKCQQTWYQARSKGRSWDQSGSPMWMAGTGPCQPSLSPPTWQINKKLKTEAKPGYSTVQSEQDIVILNCSAKGPFMEDTIQITHGQRSQVRLHVNMLILKTTHFVLTHTSHVHQDESRNLI